ncbi:MAG: copper amine oxidase N-terminal domain-containing protein [Clostridiales bacterium]|nr:copper amine oxidase N-terminal domain-containing protein [Clostridiales bacterium]
MSKIIIRIESLIVLLLLVFSRSTYAQASEYDSLSIYIMIAYYADEEGDPLRFSFLESDISPYIIDGTTMIPLRALAEGFEYVVDYQEKDKKIIIKDDRRESEMIFTIGSDTVTINGETDTMLQAPIVRDNRTFIPLRYVSEFFGKFVKWGKNVDGTNILIWVSSAQLLTDDDVSVDDNDDYYFLTEPDNPIPQYVLKSDRQTYRGIKIGDTYESVISLYGEPHKKEFIDGILSCVTYYSGSIPYDDPGSDISFYFTNGLVYYVSIYL